MSWKEIGKAINDTLFGGKIKPLNRIIEDEAYDSYYNTMATQTALDAELEITVIPYGAITINDLEYEGLAVKMLILPNTLRSIGEEAFRETDVHSIVFPPSLTAIGGGAFMECTYLQNVILPKYLEVIEESVFDGCPNLSFVEIPERVKEIRLRAFASSGLRSVCFKGTPKTIAFNAFANCTNIKHIYVPWASGEVADAPWGATNATIHYETGV